MSPHTLGRHHHHKRIREKKLFSKKSFIKDYDKFMYGIAVFIPLTTLPQAWDIWSSKSAEDVSIITWGFFTFSAICWLIYALIHRDKILIINHILWVILETLVLTGIIIYR